MSSMLSASLAMRNLSSSRLSLLSTSRQLAASSADQDYGTEVQADAIEVVLMPLDGIPST